MRNRDKLAERLIELPEGSPSDADVTLTPKGKVILRGIAGGGIATTIPQSRSQARYALRKEARFIGEDPQEFAIGFYDGQNGRYFIGTINDVLDYCYANQNERRNE